MGIELFNTDCMSYMKGCYEKQFDLAICDPPYGINVGNMAFLSETNTLVKQKNGTKLRAKNIKHIKKDWDLKPPPQEYFDELVRISKNQIVFGIEYMNWENVGNGRIKWDKCFADGVSFNRFELAYCSILNSEVVIPLLWAGMQQAKSAKEPTTQQGNKKLNEKRIHPTQKPILLYQILLHNYANVGDKIFDSHLGSGSIAIACDKMGFDLVGCEIDKEYYDKAKDRLELHQSQLQIDFSGSDGNI